MVTLKDKENASLEKRKHVRITTSCNNNCLFCLAGDMINEGHFPLEKVFKELADGINDNFTRLILSGGEASIHPQLDLIIKKGKDLGYKKIQIISNGRMFSSKKFLSRCVHAGLDEITFSIHSNSAGVHDILTRAENSFVQCLKGIKNALEAGIIVSCDIVLNKMNYKQFPAIIKFLFNIGVREIDVLYLVPFGHAFENRNDLFFDPKNAISYIHEGLRFAKNNGIVIWTNRLPAKYLEGYEDLIQDSAKIIDEMYGRVESFESSLSENNFPDCYGERCNYCVLHTFCKELIDSNRLIKSDSQITKNLNELPIISENESLLYFLLTKETLENLKTIIHKNQTSRILIALAPPGISLLEYINNSLKLSEIIPEIIELAEMHNISVLFKDIPACLCGIDKVYKDEFKINTNYIKSDGNIDIIKFAEDYSVRNKIKGIVCESCIYNDNCSGIYQKYIQAYSFTELVPIVIK